MQIVIDIEELLALLACFIEKYPSAKIDGGDYIVQNEEARKDAIELVVNIFDVCYFA